MTRLCLAASDGKCCVRCHCVCVAFFRVLRFLHGNFSRAPNALSFQNQRRKRLQASPQFKSSRSDSVTSKRRSFNLSQIIDFYISCLSRISEPPLQLLFQHPFDSSLAVPSPSDFSLESAPCSTTFKPMESTLIFHFAAPV